MRLPGIGWALEWRDDGFWRAGPLAVTDDDWVRWEGRGRPQAYGGEWGGVPTWWLVYGEVPGAAPPEVVLADGTRPPVLVTGRVWACEWYAVAQPVTVRVEGERFDLPFSEPFYRRALRDDADAGGGWYRGGDW